MLESIIYSFISLQETLMKSFQVASSYKCWEVDQFIYFSLFFKKYIWKNMYLHNQHWRQWLLLMIIITFLCISLFSNAVIVCCFFFAVFECGMTVVSFIFSLFPWFDQLAKGNVLCFFFVRKMQKTNYVWLLLCVPIHLW